jgi:hypothetical protein
MRDPAESSAHTVRAQLSCKKRRRGRNEEEGARREGVLWF